MEPRVGAPTKDRSDLPDVPRNGAFLGIRRFSISQSFSSLAYLDLEDQMSFKKSLKTNLENERCSVYLIFQRWQFYHDP